MLRQWSSWHSAITVLHATHALADGLKILSQLSTALVDKAKDYSSFCSSTRKDVFIQGPAINASMFIFAQACPATAKNLTTPAKPAKEYSPHCFNAVSPLGKACTLAGIAFCGDTQMNHSPSPDSLDPDSTLHSLLMQHDIHLRLLPLLSFLVVTLPLQC